MKLLDGLMIFVYGWKFIPIKNIVLDLKEYYRECYIHHLPLQYMVGKIYRNAYFIPIEGTEEKVVRICAACVAKKDSYENYEVIAGKRGELLLQYANRNITKEKLQHETRVVMTEIEEKKVRENTETPISVYIGVAVLILLMVIIVIMSR